MNAVRQKFRPKHQVLILRCYPKHQKNSVEVKANSSELSYLLYYASTRRSKLQKVGDFLERRTVSDVYKGRLGDIQVTLQILRALIEKTPRDLPLYVEAVLHIFTLIIRSKDVTMIEETLPTFETFCAHMDPAMLAANQGYLNGYIEIVRFYTLCATNDPSLQTKSSKSYPISVRFRKAGLTAIKAIASSDILTTETDKQMALLIPPLLGNLAAKDGRHLTRLMYTEEEKIEVEKQLALRRRQSTSTVRTTETDEADPIAASGTTEAADQIAEQETAVIALQALKQIFAVVPRGQLRLATTEVLHFIEQRVSPAATASSLDVQTNGLPTDSWSCTLFDLICSWAPVQDRFIILVIAVEELIHSPIVDADMAKQQKLATLVNWLLGSDIHFIGLSIMDVLVGLLQHMLLLLHAGHGDARSLRDPESPAMSEVAARNPISPTKPSNESIKAPASESARRILLSQIQKCIGSLAVHTYYSEQIVDMVQAILSRLRPSTNAVISCTASAIENPTAAAESIAETNPIDKVEITGFFSFTAARVVALDVVREIMVRANVDRTRSPKNSTPRSSVGCPQWEGTQWLLRDSSYTGRVAYVHALITWIKYELKKVDLKVIEDQVQPKKTDKKDTSAAASSLARRAVSNASQRERSPLRRRDAFLELLHLAIYENAHSFAESETDILLLHLLLTQLVQKLGVNAARHGLPMIFRLQEDIPEVDSPSAKINIGSLVHGYFWAISYYFEFDTSAEGRQIQNEISRRTEHGLWMKSIHVPALPLEQVLQMDHQTAQPQPSAEAVASESLKPLDNKESLVDRIIEGYATILYSPPSSPPSSPIRSYSRPMLGQSPRSMSVVMEKPRPQLSQRTREALLADWTREACIAANAKSEGSRNGSLSGSPTATQASAKHLTAGAMLPPASIAAYLSSNGEGIPSPTKSNQHRHHHHHHNHHGSRPPSAAYGHLHHAATPVSRSGRPSQSPTPLSTSSVTSAVRIEDLKAVLSGSQALWPGTASSGGLRRSRDNEADDTASESLASFEGSEVSLPTDVALPGTAVGERLEPTDSHGTAFRDGAVSQGSITPRPLTASLHPLGVASPDSGPGQDQDLTVSKRVPAGEDLDVPPVPPLPPNITSLAPTGSIPTPANGMTVVLEGGSPIRTQPRAATNPERGLSRPSSRPQSVRYADVDRVTHSRAGGDRRVISMISPHALDPGKLLDKIDADSSFGVVGFAEHTGKPPY